MPLKADCLFELQQKANDIEELDQLCIPFIQNIEILDTQHDQINQSVMQVLPDLLAGFRSLSSWTKESIEGCFHEFSAKHSLGMKDLAPTIRLLCTGTTKSLDLYSLIFYLGLDAISVRLT